jgi:hypothetical protein
MKKIIFIEIFLIFIQLLVSCEKVINKPAVSSEKVDYSANVAHVIVSVPRRDTNDFETFIKYFYIIKTPCYTTDIVFDSKYLLKPFSKQCRFLTDMEETKVIDFKKQPASKIPCDTYHNNCSTFFPSELASYYDEDSLVNQFHGALINTPKRSFKIVLAKIKNFEIDTFGKFNNYLLVFSNSGEFISGIETDSYCSNKVATIIRRCIIDKDLNIFINERQENRINECNEGDFVINYQYKIDEYGKIFKFKEDIEILPTGTVFDKYPEIRGKLR